LAGNDSISILQERQIVMTTEREGSVIQEIHGDLPLPPRSRSVVTSTSTTTPEMAFGVSPVALVSGLALLTAIGWLLMLLGSAFGVTTLDAMDGSPDGETLGVVAILWIVVSWIIAYFAGSMLVARLVSPANRASGMLHGVALWGLGITVTVVLGFMGVRGVLETGQAALTGAGNVAQASTALIGAAAADDGQQNAGLEIGAALKSAAQDVAAEPGAGVDEEAATATVKAVEELDAETLGQVAAQLLAGRPEGAKHVLAVNTSLTTEQIDRVVAAAEDEGRELKAELEAAAEKAATYAQVVLWIAFVGAATALLASIAGGLLGAEVIRRRTVAVTTQTQTARGAF
jgi:hypothetical protein